MKPGQSVPRPQIFTFITQAQLLMDQTHFRHFAPVIQNLSGSELKGAPSLYEKLTLAEEGNLRICYAPFEYINHRARVVIVGITPGHTQTLNAINEARRLLDQGASRDAVLRGAKATGAFSGAMRPNLTDMLDAIGIQRWLGINSCEMLFGSESQLVQTTSVLRNPVFVDGENYNGSPNMTRRPLLREQLTQTFAQDIAALPDAVFVPLGEKVSKAMKFLGERGLINSSRILDGLPHPSGENGERIAYFLGRKARHELSAKTNANKLDESRVRLQRLVAKL